MAHSNSFSNLLLIDYSPCNHNGSRAFSFWHLQPVSCMLVMVNLILHNTASRLNSNWELDVFKTVFEYHTHFLDGAGADTFTVTRISYCFIEVSITGSLRALQRVQDSYCVRDPHALLTPVLFAEKITCLTELPSEKDNPEKEVGFNWPDMKEKNFVCVYQMSDFLQMIAESV